MLGLELRAVFTGIRRCTQDDAGTPRAFSILDLRFLRACKALVKANHNDQRIGYMSDTLVFKRFNAAFKGCHFLGSPLDVLAHRFPSVEQLKPNRRVRPQLAQVRPCPLLLLA